MIDQLAQHIFQDLRNRFSTFEHNDIVSSSKMKAIIENRLRHLNLVTREEFDAQSSVLKRTREKLEALEKQIDDLHTQLHEDSTDKP